MQTIAGVLRTIIDQRSGVATPLSQIQVLDNWSSIFALPQEIACEGMPIDKGSAVIEGVCSFVLLPAQHRDNHQCIRAGILGSEEHLIFQSVEHLDLRVLAI
jgi:hypothetical protein